MTLTAEQRTAAVASLRTVGGVYDHIADYVQADTNQPDPNHEEVPA